ncbi:Fatty acid metabolism regulator protein [Andreprevotia sp. IGB-42]|uniref:TetR/AcrR family transcriptional regulator n=1 Tax=Andreprevotia sp. IGB-42 TaxID=2497473 RepID=UPI0013568B9D|nr:TetR/AcrR family transcriptional regulator [Andreprevotia sp. IGB-42]KAF0811320.1 Fatty acid metabolism regulator protein [Andreprevotia sp. IGB-42]
MPRQPNTESRRAQIVAAMQPVLAQLGYEKATIQAIARQAGLAPGLIHYHFKNKQEILVSLVQSISDYASQRAASQHAGSGAGQGQPAGNDAVELLRAYLHARLGLGDGADPTLVAAWVMIGAEAVRQPEVRTVYRQAMAAELATLTTLLRKALLEQQRDPAAATQIAAGLLALMTGAFQLATATPDLLPAGYAVDAAIAHAMQGIAAAPATSCDRGGELAQVPRAGNS